jgi:hypothetical protein
MDPLEIIVDDPKSSLLKVRDSEDGEYWVKRSSVHLIDGKYYRMTDRQAALAKQAERRAAARQTKKDLAFTEHRAKQKRKRDAAEEIVREVADDSDGN